MDQELDNLSKNTVVNSLMWKILERLCTQGLSMVIQIILARILLPEDFGSIAILTAVIGYASIFVQAGLGTALIQKRHIEQRDIDTLFTGSMVIALLFYLLLFFLAPFIAQFYHMNELIWPLRVLSTTLFLGAINSIQTALFARRMRFKSLFFRSLLAVPISGGVGIVMALNGYGLWALIAQSLVNTLVVVVYMSFDREIRLHFGFSSESAKSLYSFSIKILFSGLVSGFSDTCRTMVIGKKYSTRNLAYYDKAYSYSGLVTKVINTSISSVMLPAFSRSQDSQDALMRMVRRSVRMSAFVMFPVLMCVCAAAKPIVLLLLTEKWAASIPFFMLFCIFRMPGVISTIDKQLYFAMGNSSIALYYEIGLMVTQLVTLCITVPISVPAIAIGAFTVEMIGNCALFTVSDLKFGYSWKNRINDLIKPICNSMIAATAVYSVSWFHLSNLLTLLFQFVLGGLVYCIMSIITRDDSFFELKEMIISRLISNNK